MSESSVLNTNAETAPSPASASFPNLLNYNSRDPTIQDPTANRYLSAEAKRRVHVEIGEYYKASPEGIHLVPDELDMSKFHAIIIGPKDTPYEGGFFYFYLAIPSNYPWAPPKVKLMTTGNGTIRFNPNLYANGMVCLSILGTWMGPAWSPSMTLQSVLLSIQSLLSEDPYYNEPGYEGKQQDARHKNLSEEYNASVRFHTLDVGVLDMVDGTNADTTRLPQILKDKILTLFLEKYGKYYNLISKNLTTQKYDYPKLLDRLREARKKLSTTSTEPPNILE